MPGQAGIAVLPLLTPFFKPLPNLVHHVLAVRVRHVELVEAQSLRVRGLVLHAEKCRIPTRFGQQLGQGAHISAVFPAVMGQADQAVALRVAPGEQRSARRGAQRRGGMGAGEQNALGGKTVQSRAGHVRVAVDTEVTPQVVPVHEQHIVASRVRCVVVYVCAADSRHLLACRASSRLSAAPRRAVSAGVSAVSDSPLLRWSGRAELRRWGLTVWPLAAARKAAARKPAGSRAGGQFRR